MNIIQVMPEFGLAGAEIMCENLSYGLKDSGNEVTLISFFRQDSPITQRLTQKGLKIFFLNKKLGFDISVVFKLRKVFREIHPDVVHTHRYVLPYVLLASIGLKHKIIHTVHNIATKETSSFQQKTQYAIFRCNKVTPVAINQIIRETIIQRYKLKKDSVPVVYNGIDLSKCIVKQNYQLNDHGTIIHVGRFSNQKNHMRLIDAFKAVHKVKQDAQLRLIGNGELEKDILDYVRRNGLTEHVKFLGNKGNVYPYLNQADIFVLSSDYEGMPMSIIEAMGSGLPVVSTNVGGIPDMITNNLNGKLVEKDASQIADALIELLESQPLRESLGSNARKTSLLFSQEAMTQGYMRVYQW